MRTGLITDNLEAGYLPVRKCCQAAAILDGADYSAIYGPEYIADYDSMTELNGRAMKRRRSLIRQFEAASIGGWSFEELTPAGIDAAFDVERLWQREEAGGEAAFVRRCFRNFSELGLIGGILRSGGAVAGYSLSASCDGGGALILVLRARPVPAGVSAMLYRQTALLLKSHLPQLNSINLGCYGGAAEDRIRMAYHPVVTGSR